MKRRPRIPSTKADAASPQTDEQGQFLLGRFCRPTKMTFIGNFAQLQQLRAPSRLGTKGGVN